MQAWQSVRNAHCSSLRRFLDAQKELRWTQTGCDVHKKKTYKNIYLAFVQHRGLLQILILQTFRLRLTFNRNKRKRHFCLFEKLGDKRRLK